MTRVLTFTFSVLMLASGAVRAQTMTIEVAQESTAGAGDFDANVLGTVEAYTTTGTVADFYAYNGSFGGTTPDLGSFRNQINSMFVVGSDGLGLITVHGPRRGGGGRGELTASSQHDVSVGTFLTPLDVTDDPDDTFAFGSGNTRLTATTSAGGSTGDGFAVRFTDPNPVILSQLLSFSNSIEGWTVHGSGGTATATPEIGRRVRFNVSWEIDDSVIPTVADAPGWRLLSVPFGGFDVLDLAMINYVGGVPAGATNAAQYPRQGRLNARGQLAGNLFHRYEGTTTIRNQADTADSTAIIYVPVPDTDYTFAAGEGLWWYWYDVPFDLGSTSGGGIGVSYDLADAAFSLGVSGEPRLSDVSATFPLATVATHEVSPYFYMGGNPFGAPFNVDGISATGGTVQGLVYTWDPTTNGGAGGHVPLARSGPLDGSGASAAVWQGLMIEVTPDGASGPTITYAYGSTDALVTPPFYGLTGGTSAPEASKTTSGGPSLDYALTLASGDHTVDYAWLRFLPDAEVGFDRHDGSKYAGGDARIAFRIQRDGAPYRLAMNALPDGTASPLARKQNVAIDFAARDAGVYTLSWAGQAAAGWKAYLVDRHTGGRVKMWRQSSYTFASDATDSWESRFIVTVRPSADVTSVGPEASALKVAETRIGEAYPNPAAGTSRIEVVLGAEQPVRVAVYDVLGREVAVAHDGPLAGGASTVALPVSALAGGTYVVRIIGDGLAETRRLTVVR